VAGDYHHRDIGRPSSITVAPARTSQRDAADPKSMRSIEYRLEIRGARLTLLFVPYHFSGTIRHRSSWCFGTSDQAHKEYEAATVARSVNGIAAAQGTHRRLAVLS
jgi:hypothetical protein